MRIKWYGQSFFRVVFRERGGTRIVIDPFTSDCGLRVPTIKSHLLLLTHSSHDNDGAVRGDPFVINAPGEYEVRNAFVKGVPALGREEEQITMFRIEGQGNSVVHLGDLNQEELTSEQVDALGSVDVLLVPVGGNGTIDASEASKIINQIEPKAVIPMQYKIPDLEEDVAELDKFLEVMVEESVEAQENFEIKPTNLSDDGAEIAVLEPSS